MISSINRFIFLCTIVYILGTLANKRLIARVSQKHTFFCLTTSTQYHQNTIPSRCHGTIGIHSFKQISVGSISKSSKTLWDCFQPLFLPLSQNHEVRFLPALPLLKFGILDGKCSLAYGRFITYGSNRYSMLGFLPLKIYKLLFDNKENTTGAFTPHPPGKKIPMHPM